MFAVRFHGRGGQGVVTAAELPAARQSLECQDGTAPGIPGSYRSGSPDAAAGDTGRDDPHE
jgi:hypothetical protein